MSATCRRHDTDTTQNVAVWAKKRHADIRHVELRRVVQILDANYKKADLPSEVVKTCTHLSQNEQNELLEVLREFEDLFDGTLGDWKTEPVHFELKSGAKPYHSRAFPIPKVHSETIKKEVKRQTTL